MECVEFYVESVRIMGDTFCPDQPIRAELREDQASTLVKGLIQSFGEGFVQRELSAIHHN